MKSGNAFKKLFALIKPGSVGDAPIGIDKFLSLVKSHKGRNLISQAIDSLDETSRNRAVAAFMKLAKDMFCPGVVWTEKYKQYFLLAESLGLHLTPVHYYTPIPNIADLGKYNFNKWRTDGIDWDEDGQIELLKQIGEYAQELADIPSKKSHENNFQFYWNETFSIYDACVYYCMIRLLKPRLVLEVGAGFSTMLCEQALRKNDAGSIVCIEPFPREELKLYKGGRIELLEKSVLDVDKSRFEVLREGDILFYDGSHVSKTGSDVNYMLLQIIPILKPGVWIHIHDIFLPFEMPKKWLTDLGFFWNEQYMLQAFLAYNKSFKVRFGVNYMVGKHADKLAETFPMSQQQGGGGFWFQKI